MATVLSTYKTSRFDSSIAFHHASDVKLVHSDRTMSSGLRAALSIAAISWGS